METLGITRKIRETRTEFTRNSQGKRTKFTRKSLNSHGIHENLGKTQK